MYTPITKCLALRHTASGIQSIHQRLVIHSSTVCNLQFVLWNIALLLELVIG